MPKQSSQPPNRLPVAVRDTLLPSECQPFLEWIFTDVGHRPQPLRLLETAAAVRYLLLLNWAGVPAEIAAKGRLAVSDYWLQPFAKQHWDARNAVRGLAIDLWRELLDHGTIKPLGRNRTLGFLERHRDTYLATSHHYRQAMACARGFKLVVDTDEGDFKAGHFGKVGPFRPPGMMSASSRGGGSPRLTDDLSERIYCAYHALKRAKAGKIRPLIADVLSKRAPRATARGIWTYTDVNDRIKSYPSQMRVSLRRRWKGLPPDEAAVKGALNMQVQKWVSCFLMEREFDALLRSRRGTRRK